MTRYIRKWEAFKMLPNKLKPTVAVFRDLIALKLSNSLVPYLSGELGVYILNSTS